MAFGANTKALIANSKALVTNFKALVVNSKVLVTDTRPFCADSMPLKADAKRSHLSLYPSSCSFEDDAGKIQMKREKVTSKMLDSSMEIMNYGKDMFVIDSDDEVKKYGGADGMMVPPPEQMAARKRQHQDPRVWVWA
ncbi:hypothetical protein ACLB2K_040595 [Fragaria x ananassa]